MTDKMLSVIVPVYNAESTLAECIDSILLQSFQDFELILVDDGSTDSSGEICEVYVKKDSRIKTLHISNSGSFQARKVGASQAKGEYVTFSDADDWIDQGAFASAMKIISANPDIDMVAYDMQFDKDGNMWIDLHDAGIYVGNQIKMLIEEGIMFDAIYGERKLNPSLCTKFIRREMYQDIVISVHDYLTWGEDVLVTYALMCKAKKIAICHEAYYHYRTNPVSSMHTFPSERIPQIIAFQKCMREQAVQSGCLDILENHIEEYVRGFVSLLVKNWFGIDIFAISYVLPAKYIPAGCRLAIYGAGNVGKSYVRELKLNQLADVVLWVDKEFALKPPYMGVKVETVETLAETDFDVLLVAIANEAVAREICEDAVVKFGIDKERIIWQKPIHV